MSFHILELPPEIREKFFAYCAKEDLVNLACCSKSSYESVRHLLWIDLNISWESIANSSDSLLKRMENLIYTCSLKFYVADDEDDSCCIQNENDWCGDLKQTDMKLLAKKIIDLSNPKKMIKFHCECNNEYSFSSGSHHTIKYAFKKFTSLQEVCLSNYTFTEKGWLHGIGNLKYLQKLTIVECRVNPGDMKEISKARTLISLELKNNYFSEIFTSENLECLRHLNQLEELTVDNCHLVDDIALRQFKDLVKLKALNVTFSNISDSSLDFICQYFINLEFLNVKGCKKITDAGVNRLCHLKCLKSLDISWNDNITDTSMTYLSVVDNMKRLNVSDTKVGDKGISYITSYKNLKELKISSGGEILTNTGLESICNLVSLEKLVVCGNRVTDIGMSHIDKLIYLRKLDVSVNDITNESLIHISHLKKLEKLDISETKITDDGLSSLKTLTNLKKLYIEYNEVSDECLKHLCSMGSLVCLGIAGTSISYEGLENLWNSDGKKITRTRR